MRCIGCDFDLSGTSVAGRCPECGRGFDPGDLGTFLGEGHTRLARASAAAPGWPLIVVAAIYAFFELRTDFSPAGSFVAQIHAILIALVFAAIYLLRLLTSLAARAALPKRRPPVVAFGVLRWLAPLAIAVLAHVLVGLHLPRAVAFELDRTHLEPIALGPETQPSRWTKTAAWSGDVARGAVWLDVDVWGFDPATDWGTSGDPRDGPQAGTARDAYVRVLEGERVVPGIVVARIARLALLPIERTGYAGFTSAAWAYAPGAPDTFGLAVLDGLPADSHLASAIFVRHRGDWYRSKGWIAPLEDLLR